MPVHLSSLIPRMSMFTLDISYLTTSNLPWFMDLTVQVPKQYCSLQHSKEDITLMGLPDSSVGKESTWNAGDPRFNSLVGKICWRRDRLPTPVLLGFLCGSASKESAHNAGDLGSIPGLGRSPGEGKGYRLQYSGMENSMDWEAHGVTKANWL